MPYVNILKIKFWRTCGHLTTLVILGSVSSGVVNVYLRFRYFNLYPTTCGYYDQYVVCLCTTMTRYPNLQHEIPHNVQGVHTGYRGTSEIEHGLSACTVDNPLAKARGLSPRIAAQIVLYLLLRCHSQSLHLSTS